jgi:hypothetical protein
VPVAARIRRFALAALACALAGAPPAFADLRIGVTAGGLGAAESAGAAGRLGAQWARVEFAIGTPAEEMRGVVGAYADQGIGVVPLAGFPGRMPSRSEARSLAGWAREFGPGGSFWTGRPDSQLAVRSIEFGNESSYAHNGTQTEGGEYALRLRDAFRALEGTGVGLLAQADDANLGEGWVGDMFAAVPELGSLVAGWTIHPYGPRSSWEPRMDRLLAQTARHGAPDTIPMDITEWGLTTDDGRCLGHNYGWPACMTYAAAADALRETVGAMRGRYGPRLRSLFLYQATDQTTPGASGNAEHYFGALRRDMSDKGAYSAAVREQLAAAPEP